MSQAADVNFAGHVWEERFADLALVRIALSGLNGHFGLLIRSDGILFEN